MEESAKMGNGSKGRKPLSTGNGRRNTPDPKWETRPASAGDIAKSNGIASSIIDKDSAIRGTSATGGTVLPTWYHYGRIIVYAIGLTIVLFVWLMYGR